MRKLFLTATLCGALSALALVTTGRAADDKCTIATDATKGDNPVVQACKEGGIKAAKAEMKKLLAQAKTQGVKFKCDECHKDPGAGNFTLLKDAPEKFKKLLAAQK